MELRVSDNGEKFAPVFIPADVTLFADGTGEKSPYFWALGAEFGVRADIVPEGCPDPFCGEGSPVWRIQVFERTMNAPGGEFVGTPSIIRGHMPSDTEVAGVVADFVAGLGMDPLVMLTAYMEPTGKAARFGAWASGLAGELYVREGVEAFASLALDEI
jgi:hypothetical protein